MSLKFATGFEHIDMYTGGSTTLTFSELNTLFNNNLRHVYTDVKTTGTLDLVNAPSHPTASSGLQKSSILAHTKHNGYSAPNYGGYLRYTLAGHIYCVYGMKTENFTNGYYVNMWWCASSRPNAPYAIVHAFSNGVKSFGVVLKLDPNGTSDKYLAIRNMTPGEETDYVVSSTVAEPASTPPGAIQTTFSLDNTGQVTASFNGVEVTYDMSSVTGDTSFTQWQQFGFGGNPINGMIDDIIVCDGSGTEYNSLPPSVKIPFVYTEQTYHSSTNVTPSTGTIQDVLTDNDPLTYATVSPFPGMLRMSMPALSAILSPTESNNVSGVIGINSQMYGAYSTKPNQQVVPNVKVGGATSTGPSSIVSTTPTDTRVFTITSDTLTIDSLNAGDIHVQLDVT